MSRIKSILIFSVISGIILSFSLRYLFGSTSYEGIKEIPGLKSDIRITRNKNGIPIIQGSDYNSMIYALGYVHAQDRLWQMNFLRLSIKGELSSNFGDKLLQIDIFIRKLGFFNSAVEYAKTLDFESREILRFYLKGINDYISSLKVLPIEFWITWTNIKPFEIEDALAVYFAQGLIMCYEWRKDLLLDYANQFYEYEELAKIFNPKFEDLIFKTTIFHDSKYGNYDLNSSSTVRNGLNKEKYYESIKSKDVKLFLEELGVFSQGASNSWVIHGNYTKNGKPMLANDPHLDNSMPSVWYPARFYFGNGSRIYGATMPLTPSFIIGRNDHLAWGITASRTKFMDVVEEKISDDGTRFFYNNEWHSIAIREEKIFMKGKSEPFILKILTTRNGPIFNTLFDKAAGEFTSKRNLTIRSLQFIKNPGSAIILKIQQQDNFDFVMKQFSDIKYFPLNIVIAGHKDIGYVHTGYLPIQNNPNKFTIKDGTIQEDDWIGLYEKPLVIKNPPEGYIVTANNRLMSNHRYGLMETTISTSRAQRIEKVLSHYIKNGEKISTSHIQRLQCDLHDEGAEIIVPKLLQLSSSMHLSQNVTLMLKELTYWDYRANKESVGALIYNYFEWCLKTKLFIEIDDYAKRISLAASEFTWNYFANLILKMSDGNSSNHSFMCGKTKGNCLMLIQEAIEETYKNLTSQYGEDLNKWEYGKLKSIVYHSNTFKTTPLGKYFQRKHSSDGNFHTVNVGFSLSPSDPFKTEHSANYRMIVDMASTEDNLFIIDTGVSENLLSPYYDNLMKLHMNCEYIKMEEKHLDRDELFILRKG